MDVVSAIEYIDTFSDAFGSVELWPNFILESVFCQYLSYRNRGVLAAFIVSNGIPYDSFKDLFVRVNPFRVPDRVWNEFVSVYNRCRNPVNHHRIYSFDLINNRFEYLNGEPFISENRRLFNPLGDECRRRLELFGIHRRR